MGCTAHGKMMNCSQSSINWLAHSHLLGCAEMGGEGSGDRARGVGRKRCSMLFRSSCNNFRPILNIPVHHHLAYTPRFHIGSSACVTDIQPASQPSSSSRSRQVIFLFILCLAVHVVCESLPFSPPSPCLGPEDHGALVCWCKWCMSSFAAFR